MTHTVSGRISPEIYLQAQQLHRAKAVKWTYLSCAGLALIGFILVALQIRWGWVAITAGIGGGLGHWVGERFYVPYKVIKLYRQYKDLAASFSMSWDAQTLTGQGPNGHMQRPWNRYHKWKEDRHVFLLYVADNLFEVVPKAWFPSAALVDDFRQCAAQIGPVKS